MYKYLYPKAALNIMTQRTTALGVRGTSRYIHHPVAISAAAIWNLSIRDRVITDLLEIYHHCARKQDGSTTPTVDEIPP